MFIHLFLLDLVYLLFLSSGLQMKLLANLEWKLFNTKDKTFLIFLKLNFFFFYILHCFLHKLNGITKEIVFFFFFYNIAVGYIPPFCAYIAYTCIGASLRIVHVLRLQRLAVINHLLRNNIDNAQCVLFRIHRVDSIICRSSYYDDNAASPRWSHRMYKRLC